MFGIYLYFFVSEPALASPTANWHSERDAEPTTFTLRSSLSTGRYLEFASDIIRRGRRNTSTKGLRGYRRFIEEKERKKIEDKGIYRYIPGVTLTCRV